MEKFNSEDSQEIMKQFKSIISSRLEKLDDEKGSDGELYAYSIAVANQRRKQEKEPQPEKTMENSRLKEMVIDALSEKKKKKEPFKDLTGDNKITYADVLKARGVELEEDLDLGHTDNEPHMIKAELAQIGKYAMELYKMVDQFEGKQEVDFPAWWQSKITTAKNMISSAKHYLEFELKEPEIDAMVGVASEEEAIDEKFASKAQQKYLYATNPKVAEKLGSKMAKKDYKNLPEKVKEAVLSKLKNK
jgi:hypothetical protein